MRKVIIILAGGLLALAAGCENGNAKSEQIRVLRLEKDKLTWQIKESQAEREQLEKQVEVLAGLGAEVRLANLYTIEKVNVTKYTNLYDKNKDGQAEKLIVYIQPRDAQGDIIKAAGSVEVELWDLSEKQGQALLGEWKVGPENLKKMWFATVVTTNYRLMFDVGDKIEEFDSPLTVKVKFTDYLSGKVFEEQKVIEP